MFGATEIYKQTVERKKTVVFQTLAGGRRGVYHVFLSARTGGGVLNLKP